MHKIEMAVVIDIGGHDSPGFTLEADSQYEGELSLAVVGIDERLAQVAGHSEVHDSVIVEVAGGEVERAALADRRGVGAHLAKEDAPWMSSKTRRG